MPKKGEGDGAVSEVLAFIIDALKEHEQEMDNIVTRLDKAKSKQLSINKKLYLRVQKIEEKLVILQENIAKINSFI